MRIKVKRWDTEKKTDTKVVSSGAPRQLLFYHGSRNVSWKDLR